MAAKKQRPRKGVFKSLSPAGKVRYIWDYYKLHLAVILIVLYIAGFSLHRHFTADSPCLYVGMVNVAVSDQLEEKLSDGFLSSVFADPAADPVRLYKALYLTDDTESQFYQYTYASQMKILAAIDDEQMDVVFLDKEAFDAFAQNGYLYDLEKLSVEMSEDDSFEDLYNIILPAFTSNIEIVEDNAKDVALDSSVSYVADTREYPMALDLLKAPMIRDAGFTDPVFLGVLANTPRKEAVLSYIRYLMTNE